MNQIPSLQSATTRRIFLWQMVFFAALLTLSAISRTYTVLTDLVHEGNDFQHWQPTVWESTSHLMV